MNLLARVGYRAAWVSMTQIPFIYLLSCKFSLITLLTGISYERFNWLHRWAARTVFLTIIVHWSFFFREWDLAHFVQLEINMMPMVKYGFGAWSVIGWMVLSGFGFLRHANYEVFVAQHICAAAALLWLLYVHLPNYARYNVWLSVGFVGCDWGVRILWNILRNLHLLGRPGMKAPGYSAHLEALPGNMVRLTLTADFSWKAGQHAFLCVPSLRPFELHPFTIANAPKDESRKSNRLTMLVKARSGFSRSLWNAAVRSQGTGRHFRAFLSGPWGMPPLLSQYETVVLIGCSSGASFTMPLLEGLIRDRRCVRSAVVHWIIRSEDHVTWFEHTIKSVVEGARCCNFNLQIYVHVTQSQESANVPENDPPRPAISKVVSSVDERSDGDSSADSVMSTENEKSSLCTSPALTSQPAKVMMRYKGRPSVESMIRPPVERAVGESAIVVCGGLSITAQARTFVAALSDERAVAKGTGAQGICLHTETYGW